MNYSHEMKSEQVRNTFRTLQLMISLKRYKSHDTKTSRGVILKNLILAFLAVSCCLLATGTVCVAGEPPGVGPAEAMNLNFSTWHLLQSDDVQTVWLPMLDELKSRTNGSINYTLYAGGSLGSGPEHYDIVASGRSDMGYATLTWTPGRFPLSDVLSLPAGIQSKEVATDIGNDVYERILSQEFKDAEVLEVNGCIDSCLWTKKPVRTLEDLAGLKIRTPGGMQTRCLKALGAEPVFMPMDQVYLSMQNGSIDGVVTCPPNFLTYRLYEVAGCAALETFGCVSEGLFMNQDSWNRTPGDLKPVIMDVCHNPYRTTKSLNESDYTRMIDRIAEKGVAVYDLPQEESERWYSRFQNASRQWAEDMEKLGLPGKEAIKIFNEECEERGIRCVAFPEEWR